VTTLYTNGRMITETNFPRICILLLVFIRQCIFL